MKLSHYISKVKKSGDFKKFIKEDPKAYLCSVFFIRDFSGKHNETSVDFYSPKIKKIVSFKVDGKIQKIPIYKKAETIKHKKFIPKKLGKIKLDVDTLKLIILDEMHNRNFTDEIKKILIVLQNQDDRDVWNCTCFLSGLALLYCHVEDSSRSVLFMERQSFLDMMKIFRKNK